ncbi:MAG TPA: hypothetical protein DEP72_09405 [Clostridiales bacterium]|nr:MAG: hypothetical protein A2Y18_04015 [Clostridiales bacterium GWD2_32_19]HCC08357.1 hypothetical protein [Clostridiales bacterium]
MYNKDVLLKDMSGHSSTNKWDIVCCYQEDIVNNLLKEKYKQGTLVTDIKISGSYEDPFSGTILFESDLKLHEPELQFDSEKKNVSRLIMPIAEGTCSLTQKDNPANVKKYIIDPYILQLVCDVPLAATSGDTKAVHDGDVHDGKTPITFDKGSNTEHKIFLHFSNSTDTTFDIVPIPGNEDAAKKQEIFQENIRPEIIKLIATFFKEEVDEINYAMGGISNIDQPGVKTILPKSFIFSVFKPEQNSVGCLSLYIQSDDSGNGPGDINPSFQPNGSVTSPIPDGYTASIILSGDYLGKLLVSLLTDRASGKTAKVDSNTTGLIIETNIPNKVISYPGYNRNVNHWFDGININISNTPLYFNLNQDQQNVTMSSPSADGNYSNWDNCGGEMLGGSGHISASFTVNETFPLKLSSDGKLKFSFILNQSGVEVTAKTHCTSGGWEIDEEPIRKGLKANIPPQIGTISVQLDQVSMFVVGNLLFPEKNILKFKSEDSFYVPHDLIVFGNIQQ